MLIAISMAWRFALSTPNNRSYSGMSAYVFKKSDQEYFRTIFNVLAGELARSGDLYNRHQPRGALKEFTDRPGPWGHTSYEP
eukprot:6213035-Pleurochrysis_carterae.AAC.2